MTIFRQQTLHVVLLDVEVGSRFVFDDVVLFQLQDHVVAGHCELLPVLDFVHLQCLFIKRCFLHRLAIGRVYSRVVIRVAVMPALRPIDIDLLLGKHVDSAHLIIFEWSDALVDVEVEQVCPCKLGRIYQARLAIFFTECERPF